MDITAIIEELTEQRDRLTAAIDALESTSGSFPAKRIGRKGRRPGHHMSADARRRIGLAMKKRWAELKKRNKA